MKPIIFAFTVLLCTCATAQTSPDSSRTNSHPETRSSTVSRSSSSVQTETENGTHYTYSLQTNKVHREDLVQAFAATAGTTVNARFTGDWTTSDDNGIEYSMNTRRDFISVKYKGDEPEVMEVAKEKAREIKRMLEIDERN